MHGKMTIYQGYKQRHFNMFRMTDRTKPEVVIGLYLDSIEHTVVAHSRTNLYSITGYCNYCNAKLKQSV